MRENALVGVLSIARLVRLSSAQVYGAIPGASEISPVPTIAYTTPGTTVDAGSGSNVPVPIPTVYGPPGSSSGEPSTTEITTLTNGLTLTTTISQSQATGAYGGGILSTTLTSTLPNGLTTLIPSPFGVFSVPPPVGPFPGLPSSSLELPVSESGSSTSIPIVVPTLSSAPFSWETCPAVIPTTVFVTVTSADPITIFETVTSTVSVPPLILPSLDSTSSESSTSSDDGWTSWFPPWTTTIPCISTPVFSPWYTDFPTYTLSWLTTANTETPSIPETGPITDSEPPCTTTITVPPVSFPDTQLSSESVPSVVTVPIPFAPWSVPTIPGPQPTIIPGASGPSGTPPCPTDEFGNPIPTGEPLGSSFTALPTAPGPIISGLPTLPTGTAIPSLSIVPPGSTSCSESLTSGALTGPDFTSFPTSLPGVLSSGLLTTPAIVTQSPGVTNPLPLSPFPTVPPFANSSLPIATPTVIPPTVISLTVVSPSVIPPLVIPPSVISLTAISPTAILPTLIPPTLIPPTVIPSVITATTHSTCLSMAFSTISSMTFSWCAQVATSHTINLSQLPTAIAQKASELSGVTAQPAVAIPAFTEGGYDFSSSQSLNLLPTLRLPTISLPSLPLPSTLSIVARSAPPTINNQTSNNLTSNNLTSNNLTSNNLTSNNLTSKEPACGNATDVGNFIFNFGDLSSRLNDSDIKGAQPVSMPSPYHRFWFSPGFGLLHSQKEVNTTSLMLRFDPLLKLNRSSANVSLSTGGATISLGPQKSNPCFRFNYYGSHLKCVSNGTDCAFNITGLRYNYDSGQEDVSISQTLRVPACSKEPEHCHPLPVKLHGFKNLTSINISMTVEGEARPWWMNDISLGWSDNTFEAATCRSTVPDIQKRDRDPASRKRTLRKRALGFY